MAKFLGGGLKHLKHDDENKLLIGENYNALKLLLLTHKNLIDIIYIDPPYNTQSASSDGNDSYKNGENKGYLNYKDKFGRTGWLNMMKQRLELARDLLSNQGVIFISIDDSEYAYLKVLMDDIFLEQNFVCTFIWEKTYSPKNNNKFVSENHDYILCYSKSKLNIKEFNRLPRTEENNSFYSHDDNDGRGKYGLDNLTIDGHRGYDIHWEGKIFREPSPAGWRFSEQKMYELINDNRIYLPESSDKRPRFKRYLSDVGGVISKTILPYKLVGHTDDNQKSLDNIFNRVRKFKYPKGIKLIKYLIQLVPHNKDNAIILDFFAGSGTTGHAVMDLNKEDNGARRFILATNNENNIAINVTYERPYRIIKRQGTNKEIDFTEWLEKNKPDKAYNDSKLRVFNLGDELISNDIKNGEYLEKRIFSQLRLLNDKADIPSPADPRLWYMLGALNPVEG